MAGGTVVTGVMGVTGVTGVTKLGRKAKLSYVIFSFVSLGEVASKGGGVSWERGEAFRRPYIYGQGFIGW